MQPFDVRVAELGISDAQIVMGDGIDLMDGEVEEEPARAVGYGTREELLEYLHLDAILTHIVFPGELKREWPGGPFGFLQGVVWQQYDGEPAGVGSYWTIGVNRKALEAFGVSEEEAWEAAERNGWAHW